MGRRVVAFWNFLTRVRRKRCAPEKLLFLVPSCMQNSDCKQNIAHDITQCKRCGRCKVGEVVALAEKLGAKAAPCKDTDVDMAEVKAAVVRLTGQSVPED